MSMNFYISGEREITVNRTGVVETQYIHYQPWQTPDVVTREILASADPVTAYKAWIMSNAKDVTEVVYAADDPFGEGPIVGYTIVNGAKEECTQVDEWIVAVTAQGYELTYYTI